jgi:hypothetical protein
MRLRRRDFPALVVAVALVFAGCSGRTAAQRKYLVAASGSLGKCTMGSGGDYAGPFDPFAPEAWEPLQPRVRTWARVAHWRTTSRPKDPPGDLTVSVNADLEWLRGDRTLLAATVGAHRQLANAVEQAVREHLFVSVGLERLAGRSYVERGIAMDTTGRIAWLGECAHHASDEMARALARAGTEPRVVGPAVLGWISTGRAAALVATLKASSSRLPS